MVVGHPSAARYNVTLLNFKLKVEQIVLDVVLQDGGRLDRYALKDIVMGALQPKPDVTFVSHFEKFLERKDGGTKEIYQQTLNRIRAFDKYADRLTFKEINVSWLKRFEDFMALGIQKGDRLGLWAYPRGKENPIPGKIYAVDTMSNETIVRYLYITPEGNYIMRSQNPDLYPDFVVEKSDVIVVYKKLIMERT
jgi:hypothetical protein